MTRRLDRAAVGALLERPHLVRVLEALDGDGEETRVVGGAVRNALLGRSVTEIDLATTARPEAVMRRAGRAGFKVAPTGLAHGTVTVVAAGVPFEVTTLRQDVETDGRHAVVRFGRDFAADARRRDFTVNALSVDRDGRIHDGTGGLDDLAAGRIRFIGEPRERIREDYLRILRFFRFHADYADGEIDRAGFDAAVAERNGLAILSRERVRAELLKLLTARRAEETVAAVEGGGFLDRLGLGVGEAGRLARAVASEGGTPDGLRRLAAFLVRTPEDACRLRDRLRLSNAEHDRLQAYATALAALVSGTRPTDGSDVRRFAVTCGLVALADAAAATCGEPRPVWTTAGRVQLDRFVTGEEPLPSLALTGAMLVQGGVPPGPEIGRRLAEARALWLAAGCPSDPPAAGS